LQILCVFCTGVLVKLEPGDVEEKPRILGNGGDNAIDSSRPVVEKHGDSEVKALTLEDCREFVQLKVKRARAVLQKRKQETEVLHEGLKRETAALKLLEHRAEYLRRQYDLDVVALIERRGGRDKLAGSEVELGEEELEALVKKVEADDACYYAWKDTRALANKLSEAKEKMMRLANISATWESQFDQKAASLFKELMRHDISEDEAFQNAGLECGCGDVNCDYPYDVDERHNNM
ncbi:hypothetical protein M758_11G102600, partial [Ceratodon purpureus]